MINNCLYWSQYQRKYPNLKPLNGKIPKCRPTISYSFTYIMYVSYVLIYLYLLFFCIYFYENVGEHGAEQGLESVFRQHCPPVDTKQNTAAIRVVPFTKSVILLKI